MANTPDFHPPSSIFHPRPVLLAGPTAVGKSEIALRVAEQLGGEIISADSMQVYRGLDIGTAKPSPADRDRAPHHLIDIRDLSESFDAAQFARLAHRAVAEIQSRGRAPVLCGGTGLYFKAFCEGIGKAPPADATLRAELEAAPLENLLAELRERDLAAYEKIDKKNPRRVSAPWKSSGSRANPSRHSARTGPRITHHASRIAFIVSCGLPQTCTPASTSVWTRCSRAGWWTRHANC